MGHGSTSAHRCRARFRGRAYHPQWDGCVTPAVGCRELAHYCRLTGGSTGWYGSMPDALGGTADLRGGFIGATPARGAERGSFTKDVVYRQGHHYFWGIAFESPYRDHSGATCPKEDPFLRATLVWWLVSPRRGLTPAARHLRATPNLGGPWQLPISGGVRSPAGRQLHRRGECLRPCARRRQLCLG